ncbi:NAD(P)-dependent dehydrogenase (short-subunit alcohol dehydrogenase family) [Arthrobacter ginsengisoli]|uniref:NAD(P)-dependent dehydrogenase (Short-subunit alcohol dehydrogenase family) n=1 Tax=Arthrobacter ginsengisoli TaxID=1356565 RepID=A0ABU1UI06_9MICC|nr:SDR family NAD(P)-dependent oxidoreductase [Arthrobacter ginsengisoli]MDR7084822.1 NAD(P)-dependent dehydrogenase (short-subunit alcohol dehydrogenase family) [Arthrobacter ginsengisoli]
MIVTGAGRGLGRSHVEALARSGAKLIVNDLGVNRDGQGEGLPVAEEVAAAIRAQGGEAIASQHDISDWDAAGGLVQQAIDTYGRLDAVVNNAGILRDRMIVNTSEAEWDDVIRVHLRGTFAVLRAAGAYWREQAKGGNPLQGNVVNTTSPSGLFGKPGQANYGSAKAGIATLTMIAAEELGPYGVTVNAVAPVAHTRMTADLVSDEGAMQTLAPEHVSPVVVWLSSVRSRSVTGRVFEISGKRFGIAEPWRHGPGIAPQGVMTPEEVGSIADTLLQAALPPERMGGNL